MKKVYYAKSLDIDPYLNDIDVKDWFALWADYPAAKSSEWYKSIPTKLEFAGLNEAETYIESRKRGMKMSYFGSVKLCPTIKNVLTNSLVIKAPCDIDCAVAPHGVMNGVKESFLKVVAAEDKLRATRGHSRVQYTSKTSPLFRDMLNLKIDTDMTLYCDEGIEPVFMQPVYHNPKAPWIVMPGQFKAPLNKMANIIFNALVPEDTKPFRIRAGEALFYVYFGETVKLIPSDKPRDVKFRRHAYSPIQTVSHWLRK